MYPLFFIAKNNMKRRKGEVCVIFFLMALAVMFLYTSGAVLTGTRRVVDDAYKKSHAADFLYVSGVDRREEIERIFRDTGKVTELETSKCYFGLNGKYRKNTDDEKKEFSLLVNMAGEERAISRLADRADYGYDDIILPYYLFAGERYRVGDDFYLTLGKKEYKFRVAGYSEDPLLASPLNVTIYNVFITEERMEDILEKDSSIKDYAAWQYRMRLANGESSSDFDDEIMGRLTSEMPEFAYTNNMGLNWEIMRAGDLLMPNISMGIILVFSILLVLVSLIIVRFAICNFLEQNLKNVGILEALGYTSKQLKLASVLEMGILATAGILVGLGFGLLGTEIIGGLQGRMMGIAWNQGIDIRMGICTALLSFAVIIGTAWFVSRVYGRVSVLDALRGGIHAHNFRRNYFPFEKSRLPRSLVLSGKNILGEKMKNFSVFCIITLLTFAICISFALYQNFAGNTEYLMKLIGMEMGDIALSGDMQALETVGQELEGWNEVSKVLYYDNCNAKLSKGERTRTVNCDIWKEPQFNENEILLEGRLPRYDNEIVLTKGSAEAIGAGLGDVIYVEARNGKWDFIISGIDQKINHMGLDCMITAEGAKRLNGETQVFQLYICMEEGISFDEMQDRIEGEYPQLEIQDMEELVEESIGVVVTAIILICIIFVLVTIFVVAMVEVLLIRSRITREKKNYGISKALGYTTGQLIMDTVMMNMPVIVAGAVTGSGLSIFLTNPLVVLFLSSCGIAKSSLDISVEGLVTAVLGIVAVAAAISVISAVGIRKIEPVKMLTDE